MEFQVVGNHDNWELRLELLDLSCDGRAIEQAQMVLEHNCIYGARHQEMQPLRGISSGDQFVSVFLQQAHLSRIPVNTKQSTVLTHTSHVYAWAFSNSAHNCSPRGQCNRCGTSAIVTRQRNHKGLVLAITLHL